MKFIYLLTYIIIISFFIIERFIRKGKDAKTLNKSSYDKYSTLILAFSITFSFIILIITPILNYYNIFYINLNYRFIIFGYLLILIGLIIRILAAKTLGKFYMRTLRKTDNHEIISKGIYNFIRHPGYLEIILLYLGASITIDNYISFIVINILIFSTYLYRMNVEEKMQIDIFGEKYKAYIKKTKRLIPFIY